MDLADRLEGASTLICEQCGKVGRLQSIGGWISTLCGEHHRDRLAAMGAIPDQS